MMPAEKANKKFKDDRTKKRIHEHLSNEKDNISEEDIRNVKTDFVEGESIISTKETAQLSEKEKSGTTENNVPRNNEGPGIETPWNILK